MTKPTIWHCTQRRLRSAWASLSAWRKLGSLATLWAHSEDCDQTGRMPRSAWASLSAWRKLGSLATLWAHSEDSDQTGRMPRLIWVFAGRTVSLLVLSWGSAYWACSWTAMVNSLLFMSMRRPSSQFVYLEQPHNELIDLKDCRFHHVIEELRLLVQAGWFPLSTQWNR